MESKWNWVLLSTHWPHCAGGVHTFPGRHWDFWEASSKLRKNFCPRRHLYSMSVLKSTSPPSQTGTSMFAAGGVGGSVQCVSAYGSENLKFRWVEFRFINFLHSQGRSCPSVVGGSQVHVVSQPLPHSKVVKWWTELNAFPGGQRYSNFVSWGHEVFSLKNVSWEWVWVRSGLVEEILLSHEVNLDDTFDVIAKFSVTKGEQSRRFHSYLLHRAHLISSMQAVEYTGSKWTENSTAFSLSGSKPMSAYIATTCGANVPSQEPPECNCSLDQIIKLSSFIGPSDNHLP